MPAEHELRPGERVEFAQDAMTDDARSTRTTVQRKTGDGSREVRAATLAGPVPAGSQEQMLTTARDGAV